MTNDRVSRGLYLPGPSEFVRDLPQVDGFYVFGYVGPWKTPLADAVRSNLRSLSNELPGSMVVLLEDLTLIRRFSRTYGLPEVEHKVCLFVTDQAPRRVEQDVKPSGVLLDIGKLTPEQVPTILTALIAKLGDADFAGEMKWEMRKLALKKLVDKFGFGIVTTAIGFAA